MKTLVLLGVLLCVSISFAQLYSGSAFQGTWTDTSAKRSISGGVTYICVDHQTQTAHGVYNGVGLFSGYLWGNTLTGFWYEGGYDRPFGPFELTISSTGSSFTGSWSYYQAGSSNTSASFNWGASKSSGNKPERYECLAPAGTGYLAIGKYGTGNYICIDETQPFENTNQDSAWGAFEDFGNVKGFTPDSGVTLLLSDFYFPEDDETPDQYRPENQGTPFGPDNSIDDDGDSAHHTGNIPTKRIVIGRLIDDSQFCGYYWEGLYNKLIGGGVICLNRTALIIPDLVTCGSDIVYENQLIDRLDTGITSWLLEAVQDAFNALKLPPVVIVPDNPNFSHSPSTSYTPPPHPSGTSASPEPSQVPPSASPTPQSRSQTPQPASSASTVVASVFMIVIAFVTLI